MTFKKIAEIEPGLNRLLEAAKEVDGEDPDYFSNIVWYRKFKPQLRQMVGWEAKDPRLQDSDIYETAYRTVYNALPDDHDEVSEDEYERLMCEYHGEDWREWFD